MIVRLRSEKEWCSISRRFRVWTKRDDRWIVRMHQCGDSLVTIARVLRRPMRSIRHRIKHLALSGQLVQKRIRWTGDEDALIGAYRDGRLPAKELAAQVGRPVAAIYRRHEKLAVVRGWRTLSVPERMERARGARADRLWTPEGDAELVALRLQGLRNVEIARALGCSRSAVLGRVATLRSLGRWDAEVDAVSASRRAVRQQQRSADKAQRYVTLSKELGIAPVVREAWCEQDDSRLIEMQLEGATVNEIASELSRSVASIKKRIHVLQRAGRLPLRRVKKRVVLRAWTKADEDLILELNAAGLPDQEVASRADRSLDAVRLRLKRLKQVSGPGAKAASSRWTSEEDAELLRLRDAGCSREERALALRRTVDSVDHRLHLLLARTGEPRKRGRPRTR